MINFNNLLNNNNNLLKIKFINKPTKSISKSNNLIKINLISLNKLIKILLILFTISNN
jgi:hypothetical protein